MPIFFQIFVAEVVKIFAIVVEATKFLTNSAAKLIVAFAYRTASDLRDQSLCNHHEHVFKVGFFAAEVANFNTGFDQLF